MRLQTRWQTPKAMLPPVLQSRRAKGHYIRLPQMQMRPGLDSQPGLGACDHVSWGHMLAARGLSAVSPAGNSSALLGLVQLSTAGKHSSLAGLLERACQGGHNAPAQCPAEAGTAGRSRGS